MKGGANPLGGRIVEVGNVSRGCVKVRKGFG
jgi:hypothetical protein